MTLTTEAPEAAGAPSARRRQGPQPFDFRTPNKLSREHVRALQVVNETFARQLSTVLASSLRTVAQVSVGVEQMTSSAYAEATPDPSYLAILALKTLEAPAILQLPLSFAMTAVDLLLGGHGTGPHPQRPLTEIESALMRELVGRILNELNISFEPLARLDATYVQHESSLQFAPIAAPSDLLMVVTYELRVGDDQYNATFCTPLAALQPVLDNAVAQMSQTRTSGRAGDTDGIRAAISDRLLDAPAEVSVCFEPIALTSREIIDLQVGDLVPLHHPVDAPLTLHVAGRPFLPAKAGKRGKRLACVIVDRSAQER